MKTQGNKVGMQQRLLPLSFLATAISGIALHVAGHGSSHEIWHCWAVTHVVTSLVWFLSVMSHVKKHKRWYKAVPKSIKGRRGRVTFALSLAFLPVVITGIVLVAFVDGANTDVGVSHFILGILLTMLLPFHLALCRQRKSHKSNRHGSYP